MHKDKTDIVTGVAFGIGAEICRLLKSQGATVIGVDRTNTDNADQFFAADLSDPSSVDALIAALPSGVDGLANIAGVPPTAPRVKRQPLWSSASDAGHDPKAGGQRVGG